ncbi:hypothetical protein PIB30_026792 [Stylosanthes scabra]|uniref:Uncharacterized protein n=1 Tax=Stylosanthes scabra TaxID=79078 RepID=A0ABU6Z796_9FABA|nr:hypothetical protein [Stylosanthes scabra]
MRCYNRRLKFVNGSSSTLKLGNSGTSRLRLRKSGRELPEEETCYSHPEHLGGGGDCWKTKTKVTEKLLGTAAQSSLRQPDPVSATVVYSSRRVGVAAFSEVKPQSSCPVFHRLL